MDVLGRKSPERAGTWRVPDWRAAALTMPSAQCCRSQSGWRRDALWVWEKPEQMPRKTAVLTVTKATGNHGFTSQWISLGMLKVREKLLPKFHLQELD